MPKKQIGKKRPRAGSKPQGSKSVLNAVVDTPIEPQMLRTIKRWSFFRRMLGATSGDVRSFQIYMAEKRYYTVYLKD
jgi:hypothetical protein